MPGDFDLGEDELGDELAAPAASAARSLFQALQFNPQTRQHVLNADGSMASLHPVDAHVVNALFIALGKLPASTGSGVALWKIESPHDPRAQAQATDLVTQALADLIDTRDITLVSVLLETQGEHTTLIAVEYVNEHLYPRASQTRRAPF